ncbi:MAG: PilZ domain-containing protein [Bdellovibrio sp.]|nr:PilZ domain-containing protein [Bdellovibrio sp.]
MATTERRKLPRLSLGSIQFRISENGIPGRIFPLKDLSEQGMSLWLDESDSAPSVGDGQILEGALNLRHEKFPVRARTVSISPDRIGCRFEDLSSETSQALKSFLDPSVLGKELRLFPGQQDLQSVEYHGPSGTDLIFRTAPDGRYIVFTIYVLGNFIHWEEETGLSTGETRSSNTRCEQRGVMRLETLELTTDSTPDPKKLNVAKTLVLSSNLPQDTKNWCIRQLGMPY